MTMLQQYTFVCAPHPLQWAAVAALDVDMSEHIEAYRRKRDRGRRRPHRGWLQRGEAGRGVSTCFPKCRRRTGKASGTRGAVQASLWLARLQNELLIIPGNIFSGRDTHFRISYAASEETIERGLEVLAELSA